MSRRIRRLCQVLAVCTVLVAVSTPVQAGQYMNADPPSAPPMVDLVFLRPLGLGVTAVSLAFFLPAAGLTLITRPTELHKPYDAFVKRPIQYTFLDPLGEH